LKILF